MNEELRKNLSTILDLISKGMTAAGDFAMQQLPDITQQYVMYGRVWNLVMLIVLLILVGIWLWNFHKIYFSKRSRDFGEESKTFMGLLHFVLSAILVPATYIYAKDTALVWFAPKIWLIQEAAGLVKSPGRR